MFRRGTPTTIYGAILPISCNKVSILELPMVYTLHSRDLEPMKVKTE